MITSKTLATAPQYTLRLRDWKSGEALSADAFRFDPPSGSKGVAITSVHLDEVPPANPQELPNAAR